MSDKADGRSKIDAERVDRRGETGGSRDRESLSEQEEEDMQGSSTIDARRKCHRTRNVENRRNRRPPRSETEMNNSELMQEVVEITVGSVAVWSVRPLRR